MPAVLTKLWLDMKIRRRLDTAATPSTVLSAAEARLPNVPKADRLSDLSATDREHVIT